MLSKGRKKRGGGVLNSCCYILPVKEFQFLGNLIKSNLLFYLIDIIFYLF